MKNKINKIKKIILDEKKEIIFIKIFSQKKMQVFLDRIEKDIYNFHKYSLSKIILSILSDVDNTEQAMKLSKSEEKFSSVYSELKSILSIFLNLFKKYKIFIINDINIPFDPTKHQAISLSHSKEIKSNHIIEVMQKGYKLHNRILRPAMVVVAQ